VNVDRAQGLSRRAPLVACRLHAEHLVALGRLDNALLPWPTADELRSAARVHLQDLAATLWQRLTSPACPTDPVAAAILASRSALDALRYRQLIAGRRVTAARAVLAAAGPAPWLDGLHAAWDVARELVPPPPADAVSGWLQAALACVRDAQDYVG
jgi:hypothetical protein